MQQDKGFTLVELMIAIAIAAVIILAITTLMEWSSKGYQNAQEELDVQMETQMVVNMIGDRILEGNHAEFSNNTLTIYSINETDNTIKNKNVIWLDLSSNCLYLFEGAGNASVTLAADKESLFAQNVNGFYAEISKNKVTIQLTIQKAKKTVIVEQKIKMRNKYVELP